MLNHILHRGNARRAACALLLAAVVVPIWALAAAPAHGAATRSACGPKWKRQASTASRKAKALTVAGTNCREGAKLIQAWAARGKRPGCVTDRANPSRCTVKGYKCTSRYSHLPPGAGIRSYEWVRYNATCSSRKNKVQFTVLLTTVQLITTTFDPVDSITDYLIELAKDPLKNFILDALGLPVSESEFSQISKKIDLLSAQLTAAESRITTQIKQLELQGRLDYLQDVATDLNSLFADYFKPLVASILKVKAAQAKVPKDQAAIDNAMQDYSNHKAAFLSFADSIKLTTLGQKIHNRLQPLQGPGVLRQYGSLILAAHRHVNSSDSARVIGMYRYLEEYQAFATWMKIERQIAVGGSSLDLIKQTMDAFTTWIASQRDQTAVNGLHAPIPAGVVIDRGPDASVESYTTVNRPMFMFFKPTDLTWAPFAFHPPSGDTVPNAQAYANEASLRGFKGWSPPSGGQLYGLFARLSDRNHDKTVTYLSDLFQDPKLTLGSFLWDTDSVQQRYCVKTPRGGTNCNHFATAHRGVSTTTLSNDIHPQFEYVQESRLDERYKGAVGGLLLVRDTGAAQYLP